MQLNRILREGFIAGCIGAAAVAVWFLVVDTLNGRPFFTPAMLGSAVFWGVHDPARVIIQYSNIIGYTMIHVSAFVVVGCIAAQPLLGALVWWNVAIGNAIAAFGMGYYLWREHPKIGEELRKHPLGETQEGEQRPPAFPSPPT